MAADKSFVLNQAEYSSWEDTAIKKLQKVPEKISVKVQMIKLFVHTYLKYI